jgi:threonine aldolase
MRQAGIIAAGALYAIDNHRERLHEDHRKAKTLARGLDAVPGFRVNADHVDTNIVIVEMSERGLEAVNFQQSLQEKGVLITLAGQMKARLVTHLDVSEADIDEALGIINDLFH